METLRRGWPAALVCGAVGPVAALVAAWLLTPALLGHTIDLTSGADLATLVGETLVGLFLASLLLTLVMGAVGATVTLAALVLTGCPRPGAAAVTCVVLTPVWAQAVEPWAPSLTIAVLALGLVPAVVRAAFGMFSAT
jgi:hypothetical protein